MSIPKELLDRMEKWSKQLEDLTFKDVKKRFKEILEEEKDIKKAAKVLRAELRIAAGLDMSSAEWFRGYIINDTGLIDFVSRQRNYAMYLWETDRERAISEHICDKNGTPLDVWEHTVGFQKNMNKGNPIPEDEHRYYRAYFGVCGEGKEMKNIKFFKLHNYQPDKFKVSYVPLQIYDFRATVRNVNEENIIDGLIELNVTSVTKFKPVTPDATLEEKYNMLSKSGYKIWNISELRKALDMGIGVKEQYPILIEANVPRFNPNLKPRQRYGEEQTFRTLILDDDRDESLTTESAMCFLDGEVPIEFGYNSRLVFLGTLGTIGEGDKERVLVEAKGYLPVPNEIYKKDIDEYF